MRDPLITVTYSLTREQVEWLKSRGENESRRGASSVLREVIDAAMKPDVSKEGEAA